MSLFLPRLEVRSGNKETMTMLKILKVVTILDINYLNVCFISLTSHFELLWMALNLLLKGMRLPRVWPVVCSITAMKLNTTLKLQNCFKKVLAVDGNHSHVSIPVNQPPCNKAIQGTEIWRYYWNINLFTIAKEIGN